jgi:hypothetical protein
MVNILGIDAGQGSVKVNSSIEEEFKYSSLYAPYMEQKFVNDLKQSNDIIIEWMEDRYFVGDSAMIHSTPIQTVTKDRMINKEGKIHIMTSLVLAMPEGNNNCNIVVGLPIDEYNLLKNQYCRIVSGQHEITQLNLNGTPKKYVNVKVNDVLCLPQPMGGLYSCFLDPSGELINKSLVTSYCGIIDLGYRCFCPRS